MRALQVVACLAFAACGPGYEVPFRYSIDVKSSADVRRVDLTDNVGTQTFSDKTLPAIAAQAVAWVDQNLQLITVYALDKNDVRVTYVYCREGITIGGYFESLTVPMVRYQDDQYRSCKLIGENHSVSQTMLRPFVDAPSGMIVSTRATVSGSSGVEVKADGTGHVVLGGQDWRLNAFGFVDCSEICGQPGWYEVHSLIRGADGSVGVVVLYLRPNTPDSVVAGWGIRLDKLEDLPITYYPAKWVLN